MSSGQQLEVGAYVPQVNRTYDELRELALDAERHGFETFWLFDHLYTPGVHDLPALEGWTATTALLAHTTTLRVGCLVLCTNFRHPWLLTKMVASLDSISEGRLELGLGSGSYDAEHHEAGLPWGTGAERSGRLAETLEILTRSFAGDVVHFEGEQFQIEGLRSLPRPTQQPGPPIHIGGAGHRYTLPLVARYADVWNVPTYALADWEDHTRVLDAECDRIGRDPASIRRSHQAVLALADHEDELPALREAVDRRFGSDGFGLEHAYVGTPAMVTEQLQARIAQGITAFAFFLSAKQAPDTMATFAADVRPHL